VLALDTVNAPDRAEALTIEGVESHKARAKDQVAAIARRGQGFETFSLVNFMGVDTNRWETALSTGPDPLVSLAIQIRTDRPVARVWWASPDGGAVDAQPVSFTTGTDGIPSPCRAWNIGRWSLWNTSHDRIFARSTTAPAQSGRDSR
jgi:hypothetical protein